MFKTDTLFSLYKNSKILIMKILVIDDNEQTTTMLSKFFNSKGFQTTTVNDPWRGLSIIQTEKFDVIILDISMPNFSGNDIIGMLATDEILQNQKIIIFSAAGFTTFTIKDFLRREGIHAVVKKPIRLEELLRIINSPKKFEYC